MSNWFRVTALTLSVLLAGLFIGEAQIAIPYTFTPGTTIQSSQVNANFSATGTNALNRTGGTMTGTLNTRAITPVASDVYPLGDVSHKWLSLHVSNEVNTGSLVAGSAAITNGVTVGNTVDGLTVTGPARVIGSTLLSGNLDVNGLGYFFGSTGAGIALRHTTLGTANASALTLGNNGAANAGTLTVTSSNYTAAGSYPQDGMVLQSTRVGGLSLAASAGTVRLYAGGAVVPNVQLHASGGLSVGAIMDPAAAGLSWSGATFVKGVLAPPQITGNINNYAPAGFATASVLFLDASSSFSITGLAGGAEGRLIVLNNTGVSAQPITLQHISGSSAVGNKFALPGAVDVILTPGSSIRLVYYADVWRSF